MEKEDKSLHDKVNKQNYEISQQRKEIARLHAKLRKAALESTKANRQRDQRESQELEAKIQHAIRAERQSSELKNVVKSVVKNSYHETGRNDSLVAELKKLIDAGINNFLEYKRICVNGRHDFSSEPDNKWIERTIQFGYVFQRKPTVSVSIGGVYNGDIHAHHTNTRASTRVKSVSNSSSIIQIYRFSTTTAIFPGLRACDHAKQNL